MLWGVAGLRYGISVRKIPACEQLPETDASTEGERLRRPGKQPRCGKPGTGIETARSEKFGFGDMAEMDVSLLVRLSSGFLAVYPGIYSYDASAQLLQFYGKLPLTTHHPLIHTLYLGLCMKIAGRLFHTYQAGMALYALSQSFFMSAVFFPCVCAG